MRKPVGLPRLTSSIAAAELDRRVRTSLDPRSRRSPACRSHRVGTRRPPSYPSPSSNAYAACSPGLAEARGGDGGAGRLVGPVRRAVDGVDRVRVRRRGLRGRVLVRRRRRRSRAVCRSGRRRSRSHPRRQSMPSRPGSPACSIRPSRSRPAGTEGGVVSAALNATNCITQAFEFWVAVAA